MRSGSRRENDAGFYLCFWHVGHEADKIHDKFGIGMGNDRQIGVDALCGFFGKFDIDRGLLWLLYLLVVGHDV